MVQVGGATHPCSLPGMARAWHTFISTASLEAPERTMSSGSAGSGSIGLMQRRAQLVYRPLEAQGT